MAVFAIAEAGRRCGDPTAQKVKNIYYLALNRKHVLTPDVNQMNSETPKVSQSKATLNRPRRPPMPGLLHSSPAGLLPVPHEGREQIPPSRMLKRKTSRTEAWQFGVPALSQQGLWRRSTELGREPSAAPQILPLSIPSWKPMAKGGRGARPWFAPEGGPCCLPEPPHSPCYRMRGQRRVPKVFVGERL